jgi:hypothetical protein
LKINETVPNISRYASAGLCHHECGQTHNINNNNIHYHYYYCFVLGNSFSRAKLLLHDAAGKQIMQAAKDMKFVQLDLYFLSKSPQCQPNDSQNLPRFSAGLSPRYNGAKRRALV